MLRAIVLGIVQGITEFLPISSSAHLSIVPRLLGYATPTLAFEVLLHFGTLAAVAAYFARDLWAFVLCLVAPGRLGPEEAATRRRLLGLLALASVPAAAVGFLLQDWADEQTDPAAAGVGLAGAHHRDHDRGRALRPGPDQAGGPGPGGERGDRARDPGGDPGRAVRAGRGRAGARPTPRRS